MLIQIFERGIDWETLIEVPDALYQNPKRVDLIGHVTAEDHHGRLLISFADMMVEGPASTRPAENPVWLPGNLVRYDLADVVDAVIGEVFEPPAPYHIPVGTPDGRIFETNAPRLGWAYVTIPNWLAASLEQLTTEKLRLKRAERAIAEDEAKRKLREQAASLLRQEKAHEAARKKRERKNPGQGELL